MVSLVRAAVSAGLLFHFSAVLGGALGVPPSSVLEQSFAELFKPYHELMDLGYSYRYYAEPPPTPVVTATLGFGDGRPEESVRLPGLKVTGPRMRHQRQLALANACFRWQSTRPKNEPATRAPVRWHGLTRVICVRRGPTVGA